MRKELNEAVKIKDFKAANVIKEKMSKVIQKNEKIKELNFQIKQAVQKEDFLVADKLNHQLVALISNKEIETPKKEFHGMDIVKNSLNRAAAGGLSGSIFLILILGMAMSLQVITLMWMRTIMNYQYKYGTTTKDAFHKLYAEGGVRRFYRGIGINYQIKIRTCTFTRSIIKIW
jgi:hypothetical protein